MAVYSWHLDRAFAAVVCEFTGTVAIDRGVRSCAVLDVAQAARAVTFPGPTCSAVVAVLRALVSGLGYIHQRRYLHLDIHPGNVLLPDFDTPQALKIVDFGSAQAML